MLNDAAWARIAMRLFLADLTGTCLAFVTIFEWHFRGNFSAIDLNWYIMAALIVCLGIAVYFLFTGLYSQEYRPFFITIGKIIKGDIFVALCFLSGVFFIRFISLSRVTFAIYFILIPPYIIVLRYFVYLWLKSMRRKGYYLAPVVLVDFSEPEYYQQTQSDLDKILYERFEDLGLKVFKRIDVDTFSQVDFGESVKEAKGLNDHAVVVMIEGSKELSGQVVRYCEKNYIQLMVIPQVTGIFTAPFEIFEFNGLPILTFKGNPLDNSGLRLKRLLDIIGSALGLFFLGPLLIIIALVVRLDSKGPVLFKHQRLGHNGQIIGVYKFRTMHSDANERLKKMLENPEFRNEYETSFKLRNDPRITRVGEFIRKTSLDELPQLLNVFKGEMTLVGPRPIVPKELDMYGDAAPLILRVVPGITGLWQTSGRSDLTYEERIRLDMLYINNWSFWLDIQIFMRTFPTVIGRKGAC